MFTHLFPSQFAIEMEKGYLSDGTFLDLTNGSTIDVVCAVDGSDALRKLARYDPQIILLDIMMAPMDGLEFLKCLRVKGLQGTYPIIIMTAMFGIEEELRTLQRKGEVVDVVLKPLGPLNAFLQLIENVSRHQKKGPEQKA